MGTPCPRWWVAVLFIIGPACFAISPLPGYLSAVGYTADAITFFIGSLFFTSAAFLQYVEVEVTPSIGAGTSWYPTSRVASFD